MIPRALAFAAADFFGIALFFSFRVTTFVFAFLLARALLPPLAVLSTVGTEVVFTLAAAAGSADSADLASVPLSSLLTDAAFASSVLAEMGGLSKYESPRAVPDTVPVGAAAAGVGCAADAPPLGSLAAVSFTDSAVAAGAV